jgi:hypothetical protein
MHSKFAGRSGFCRESLAPDPFTHSRAQKIPLLIQSASQHGKGMDGKGIGHARRLTGSGSLVYQEMKRQIARITYDSANQGQEMIGKRWQ